MLLYFKKYRYGENDQFIRKLQPEWTARASLTSNINIEGSKIGQ